MIVKTKIKTYPDGRKKAIVYKKEFIKGSDIEKTVSTGKKGTLEPDDDEYIKQRNLQRSKSKIRDYVDSNEFDLFITLTFAEDRKDDDKCFKKLNYFLKNIRRKYGKFDYLIIPERHKDGSLHFHGVFGRFKGDLSYSGVKHKGVPVLNLTDWKHGYTTATTIQDKEKTASYVTKYVTKDLEQDLVGKGKKKYWLSRGLRLPVEDYYSDIPFADCDPAFENNSVLIYNL